MRLASSVFVVISIFHYHQLMLKLSGKIRYVDDENMTLDRMQALKSEISLTVMYVRKLSLLKKYRSLQLEDL